VVFRLVGNLRLLVVRLGFFLARLIFVVVRMFTRSALRFVVARLAESLRLARRLDAAERPAEFVNLAFVREFLTLGYFNQFEHFVNVIHHLLERVGNFRGVLDGLTDGRSLGGFKIGVTRARRSRFRCRRALNPLTAFRPVGTLGPVRPIRPFWPLLHEALRRWSHRFGAFAFSRQWRLLQNGRFTGCFSLGRFRRDFVRG